MKNTLQNLKNFFGNQKENNIQNLKKDFSLKTSNILKNKETIEKLSEDERKKILFFGDQTTKNILTQLPQLIPTHKIKIDEKIFYLTSKIESNNENKRIFFVENNGKFEPRVIRLSGSGKKAHTFPGYDIKTQKKQNGENIILSKRYSKGETVWNLDYESGVNTDSRLIQALENMPNNGIELEFSDFGTFLAKKGYTVQNYETKESLKEFEKINISNFINKQGQVRSLMDLTRDYRNFKKEKQEFAEKNPKEFMKKIFENIKLDEKIFEKFIKNNYSFDGFKFRILSKENDENKKYEIAIGKYQGQILSVIIVHPKNNKNIAWVESFNIINSPITSYGITKHRISGGIFTTKPKEYFGQIPEFIQKDMRNKNPDKNFYTNETYDISQYLQENPFIVAFKNFINKTDK